MDNMTTVETGRFEVETDKPELSLLEECLEIRESINRVIDEADEVRNINLRDIPDRGDVHQITETLASIAYENALDAAKKLKVIIRRLEDAE